MERKKITIDLRMDEIVYDVQNKTYLTGRSRADGTTAEHVAAMQANDDDENANQVLRSIGAAMGVLTTRLADYMDSDAVSASDVLLEPDADLKMELTVPSNFNSAAVRGIAEAAHAYITAAAVGDWFAITDPQGAAEYRAAAERWLEVLTRSVTRRRRPLRGAAAVRTVPPIA